MMLKRTCRALLAAQSGLVTQRTSRASPLLQFAVHAVSYAAPVRASSSSPSVRFRAFHSSSTLCHRHDDGAKHSHHKHENCLPMDQVIGHIDLMENWSCSGCGIDLQYTEPKKVGYLPKQLLGKLTDIYELKKLNCERCYNIIHYGKITDAKLPYSEYEKRVAELKTKDMLMIQLVDILDIKGSLLPKARHLFGNKDVMLVVNKGDLLPEKSGIRRLMRRIQTEAKAVGIENIKAVYLVSAMKGIGMKEIVDDVKKFRQGRDVCVVGAANVGKSTFLNSLMKFLSDRKWQHNHRKYMKMKEVTVDELQRDDVVHNDDEEEEVEAEEKLAKPPQSTDDLDIHLEEGESIEMYDQANEEDRQMTTSPLPGTTLAVQHLPIIAKNELFNVLDTPGLIVDSQRQKLIETLALDSAAQLKNVFPTKTLPMTTYRIQPGRSLFLGALVRFDYESSAIENTKNNLLLFSWHGVLPGHLTSTANAVETFIKHAGGLLSPPRGLDGLSFTGPLQHSQDVYLTDYMTKEVLVKSKNPKKPKRTSVVELEVPGFGWLTVTAVDLDGTSAAEMTLKQAKISISTCRGLSVVPRSPLFPYEMSTSKAGSWKS